MASKKGKENTASKAECLVIFSTSLEAAKLGLACSPAAWRGGHTPAVEKPGVAISETCLTESNGSMGRRNGRQNRIWQYWGEVDALECGPSGVEGTAPTSSLQLSPALPGRVLSSSGFVSEAHQDDQKALTKGQMQRLGIGIESGRCVRPGGA